MTTVAIQFSFSSLMHGYNTALMHHTNTVPSHDARSTDGLCFLIGVLIGVFFTDFTTIAFHTQIGRETRHCFPVVVLSFIIASITPQVDPSVPTWDVHIRCQEDMSFFHFGCVVKFSHALDADTQKALSKLTTHRSADNTQPQHTQ